MQRQNLHRSGGDTGDILVVTWPFCKRSRQNVRPNTAFRHKTGNQKTTAQPQMTFERSSARQMMGSNSFHQISESEGLPWRSLAPALQLTRPRAKERACMWVPSFPLTAHAIDCCSDRLAGGRCKTTTATHGSHKRLLISHLWPPTQLLRVWSSPKRQRDTE